MTIDIDMSDTDKLMKFLINLIYYIFTRKTITLPSNNWFVLMPKGSIIELDGIPYKVIKHDYKCFRAERLIVCKYKVK